MRTIINTVGTSLLTNAARSLGVAAPDERQVFQYLHSTGPEAAAAETNSLSRLLREGDRLVFLHSQTAQGQLCADILCRFFSGRKISCAMEAIPDLSYSESRFKMMGLRSLVGAIIKLIRTERAAAREVVINATGGFKAEIAYATLIGLLFDVPVFYIHEAFREIIEMPPTPIAWDYGLIAEHEEFFDWIDSDLRDAKEADARLKSIPPEVRFLLNEEEGFMTLSPAGEVFYEAYRTKSAALEGVPIFLSDKALRSLTTATPDERRIIEKALVRLRDPILRRSGSGQKNNTDCLVYPKGRRPERIFYYEDDDGVVYVCDLTASHQEYERLMDKVGVRRADYDGFTKFKSLAALAEMEAG